MKRKLVFWSLILVLVVAPLVACAKPAPTPTPTPKPTPTPTPTPSPATPTPTPTPTPAQPQTFTLSVLHDYGTSAEYLNFSAPDYRFQTLAEGASGGRLKFQNLTNPMPQAEFPLAVIQGRGDMANFHPSFSAGTFPFWDVALPFVHKTAHDYEKFINDPELVDIQEKSYRKEGLQLLALYGCDGLNAVWANKPMPKIDDFKGMKIRGGGLLPVASLKVLGAAPVTLSPAATVEAIVKGTIDAAFFDTNLAYSVGMADVTKYVNRWVFTPLYADAIAINAKKYDALPADLQKILRDTAKRIGSEAIYASIIAHLVVEQAVERQGLKIITPDEAELKKAKELTKDVPAEWIAKVGPDGEKVLAIARRYSRT